MAKDFPKYVAEIIPTDLQDEMSDNRQETLTDFGIAVMNGAKQSSMQSQVVAVDSATTSGTDYLQYADGSIKKWTSDIRYSAPAGTLWANRATATYTAETV